MANGSPPGRRPGAAAAAVILALLTVLLAGCGGASERQGAGQGDGGGSAPVVVSAPWARTSPAGASTGAAYLTLTAAQDDALVGASVDASVAAAVQIHATTTAGHDTAGHGSSSGSGSATTTGALSMKPVERIELPKGKPVTLEPGGYHLMLVDLAQPLRRGGMVTLTLRLAVGGELSVGVPVRDNAP